MIGTELDPSQNLEGIDLDNINLNDWYGASDAADRLTRNSGKPIAPAYARNLARYKRVRNFMIGHNRMYYKPDIDAYVVEARGEKSGRASRQHAKPKVSKKQKVSKA